MLMLIRTAMIFLLGFMNFSKGSYILGPEFKTIKAIANAFTPDVSLSNGFSDYIMTIDGFQQNGRYTITAKGTSGRNYICSNTIPQRNAPLYFQCSSDQNQYFTIYYANDISLLNSTANFINALNEAFTYNDGLLISHIRNWF